MSGLYRVHGATETREQELALQALGEAESTLVVRPTLPAGRGADWAARCLLKAMGARASAPSPIRNAQRRFDFATARLIGHGYSEIVVLHSDRLNAHQWRLLVEAALVADARLWLICDEEQLKRGLREFCRELAIDSAARDELFEIVAAKSLGAPASRTAQAEDDYPYVPRDEFPLFRARCRELLEPHEMRQVDHRLRATARATAQLLTNPSGCTNEQILEMAYCLVEDAPTLDEAITALRAMQCTLLPDWHLRVNVTAISSLASDRPSPLNLTTVRKLEWFANPVWAAVGCLQLLAPAGRPERLLTLRVCDLEEDCSRLRLATAVEVPEPARRILRTLLTARRMDGALADDPLLATDDGARLSARTVTRAVKRIAEHTGLRLRVRDGSRARANAAWRSGERVLSVVSL